MHSHFVLMLLVFIIYTISARNIYDQNNIHNEKQEIIPNLNENLISLENFEELLKFLQNEQNYQEDFNQFQPIKKRAKAIVKGDPREFMG